MTAVGTRLAGVDTGTSPSTMGLTAALPFTPTATMQVDHLHFFVGAGGGSVTAAAYGIASALGSGDPNTDGSLTWLSKVAGAATTGVNAPIEISFPSTVVLTAGVQYFLVSRQPDVRTFSAPSDLVGGTLAAVRYGTNWASTVAATFRFELYGTPGSPALTSASPARLRKVGFSHRAAELLGSSPTSADYKVALRNGTLTPRQVRTLQRGDLSMKALLRGGFNRHQAKLISGA